jgi:hypothetical protein
MRKCGQGPSHVVADDVSESPREYRILGAKTGGTNGRAKADLPGRYMK